MERLGRLLTVLILVLLGSAVLAPPAMADSEYLNHIDVTYDVQADGTIDVRYEINWHFPEKGRHGINLGFATRESWDQDRTKDVVYEITDVQVSSPTGAPAQFVEGTDGSGSDESLTLRIGDPDIALDTQDATYVIEYTLAGALRTFDGVPQLYWDVNSPNLPELRRFTARVTAPEGVVRARCLVGPEECESAVEGGVATFSHEGGPGVTSVVAEFPAGSVANAEPVLEDRRIRSAEMRGLDSAVEVQPDGSAKVLQEIQMVFPDGDDEQRVELGSFARLPWDEEQDQILTVEDLLILDERGQSIPFESSRHERDASAQRAPIRFGAGAGVTEPEPLRTFEVSYVLRGAVGIDGDVARLRMPTVPMHSGWVTDANATWTLPGDVLEPGCLQIWYYQAEPGEPCAFDTTVDGATITADAEALAGAPLYSFTDFAFPASAIASTEPLQPSLDAAKKRRRNLGLGLGVGGVGLGVGVGIAAAKVGRRRDDRFATVPPGVMGTPGLVKPASRSDNIPVRFQPPRLQPWEAGLLMDRQYEPRHLAATLVSLAVRGGVRLGTRPLMVQRIGNANVAQGVERRVLEVASRGEGKLTKNHARAMRTAVYTGGQQRIREAGWFHQTKPWLRAMAVTFLPFAPLALLLNHLIRNDNPLPGGMIFIGAGLAIGGLLGAAVGQRSMGHAALTAEGRALLDQVEGFEQYIATAEAPQLNFEAEHDIFRRYLPWAVLFDLTDRWTKVCRELAEQGRIDPPDTSFWVGASSFDNFGREMSRFSRDVGSASKPPSSSGSSSSGGSGGSSGFSSSSSGGGGGGGTSGSSW